MLPVVLGHEVVGRIERRGPGANRHREGGRVGVGWIHRSDGTARENLSPEFEGTGRDVDGGYAEYMTVPEDYAHPIPDVFSDVQAAPLLCAGAIGYRALRLTKLQDGERHLWMEREIKSVANITRQDIAEFLPLAAEIPPQPTVETYPLEEANRALRELRQGPVKGAKVLVMG